MLKNSLTVLQIILSSGGAIALIIATILSINQITKLDDKISALDSSITKLRDGRIGAMVAAINYGKDFVFRRIELLERNMLIQHQQPESGVVELTKRIFDNTAKMAEQWSYWYGGDSAKQLQEETSNKIKAVYENAKLSPLQKIDEAEKIWKDSMTAANERLQKAQQQLHEEEKKKAKLEKEKSHLHNKFVAWQLGGLIALALGGLIEGALRL